MICTYKELKCNAELDMGYKNRNELSLGAHNWVMSPLYVNKVANREQNPIWMVQNTLMKKLFIEM